MTFKNIKFNLKFFFHLFEISIIFFLCFSLFYNWVIFLLYKLKLLQINRFYQNIIYNNNKFLILVCGCQFLSLKKILAFVYNNISRILMNIFVLKYEIYFKLNLNFRRNTCVYSFINIVIDSIPDELNQILFIQNIDDRESLMGDRKWVILCLCP